MDRMRRWFYYRGTGPRSNVSRRQTINVDVGKGSFSLEMRVELPCHTRSGVAFVKSSRTSAQCPSRAVRASTLQKFRLKRRLAVFFRRGGRRTDKLLLRATGTLLLIEI